MLWTDYDLNEHSQNEWNSVYLILKNKGILEFKAGFNFCSNVSCVDDEITNPVSENPFGIGFVRWSEPAIPPIVETKEEESDYNI